MYFCVSYNLQIKQEFFPYRAEADCRVVTAEVDFDLCLHSTATIIIIIFFQMIDKDVDYGNNNNKFTPEQATKAQRESRVISLLLL